MPTTAAGPHTMRLLDWLPAGLTLPVAIYLGAIVLALWAIRQMRGSLWLLSLLVLPGTICHELSHFLMGLLLNGQPHGFSVWPRRVGRVYLLGSVALGNPRWYNVFFIGLAPLLLLPLAYLGLRWRLAQHPVFDAWEAGAVFLIANLVFASIPSGQDLRIAARSPIGWGLLVGGVAWAVLR